jgi:hypothetical protein
MRSEGVLGRSEQSLGQPHSHASRISQVAVQQKVMASRQASERSALPGGGDRRCDPSARLRNAYLVGKQSDVAGTGLRPGDRLRTLGPGDAQLLHPAAEA